MSTHRWCCCGANPENPCAESCDFASSYMLGGFTGNHSFNREWRADPCEECSNYDGPNLARSIGFTAAFSQVSAIAITRYSYTVGGSTSCCYRGGGVMNVSWTLSIADRYYRCPGFNGICLYTEDKSNTTQTDFCIEAHCRENPLTGQVGWLWTLSICSFALDQVQTVDVTNLPANYNCGDEPPLGNPYGVVAGGAVFSWWTRLVNPSSLTISDAAILGCCTPALSPCGPIFPGTDPGGLQQGCMWTMSQMCLENGPCTLVSFSPLTNWPPDPCEIVTANSFDPGSFFGCDDSLLPGACAGQIDFASACCEVNLSHAWTWGVIY